MYERSNRTVLKENVSPRAHSSIPSNQCMVIRGGPITASLRSFPGMEHDRQLFNGLSQETPLNGISGLIDESNAFDEEKEIEAAAAASEAHLRSQFASKTSIITPETAPPINTADSSTAPTLNQTLSPLHINVNECTKIETLSRDSELSSNGSTSQQKVFQQPSLRITHRPSTSNVSPIIMGPPSSTNTQVLLSPAGNLQNGYQRISSGDSAPSSPAFTNRQTNKGGQYVHPLAAQRLVPQSRTSGSSSQVHINNRPSASLASPSGSGRKDHEMSRRRTLVDRITKSRGSDYVHLMSQTEGLSHTQTTILLRKHRTTLQLEGMPHSLQMLIECNTEPDKSQEFYVKKINEANQKRVRHNDLDDLTDVSDLEDNINEVDNPLPKASHNIPRWTPKRMRYSGMLSRAETLLAEKVALMGMLKAQKSAMDKSCGVRFIGEEIIPRRRRQLNGMYYLYDKSTFHRATSARFGCARAMPIQSWTKRKLQKNVFDEMKNVRPQYTNSSAVMKPSTNPKDKWVATAQHETVTYLTNGEKREITEYDYEEYKAGEGLKRVNELSSFDPMAFVATSDFFPLEDRQMTYIHQLSTAPSSTIRKKHDKAIYFESDDRKPADKNASTKKKADRKKERKRLEEASSDEEETKLPAQKRPRGRPVATRKKSSKASTNPYHGIYLDYLFEDFLNEDVCVKQLPTKITYAHIHVPQWSEVPENYWKSLHVAVEQNTDELLVSVAKNHHRLMHAERERIKQETDKRNRNRTAAQKSAAATPAHNTFEDGDEDSNFPPFDMRQFEPSAITSRRRFASIEKPFEQRNFHSNQKSESTN